MVIGKQDDGDMASVVSLESWRKAGAVSAQPSEAHVFGSCEIIIFPGVRFERLDDVPPEGDTSGDRKIGRKAKSA